MTFISWAQNYEDVMLFRALRGVERGFYIDVGAQDPAEDSVTKAFYERGWHGINIEPVEHWYRRLLEDRPHDINLRVAVSDQPGELELFEVEGTGLSTTDETFAARHRAQGLSVHESRVKCVTLDEVCKKHKVGTVHFLKVDCEGAEESALRGMSFKDVRPWIVLVEASEPNSTTPTHQQWEPLLLERGYGFVYADGINRYYLADEHPELREAFASPPNVLDDFMRVGEDRAHRRAHELHEELLEVRSLERRAHIEAARDEWQRQADRWRESDMQARSELVERNRELARLQGEVAGFYAERSGLERIHAKLRTEIEHRVQQARNLEREVGRLQGDVARLDIERDTAMREAARSRDEVRSIEREIARLQDETRGREAEIVRLQGDVARLDIERDTAMREAARSRDKVRSIEREIARLQNETRGQGEEIARLRQEYRDNAAEHAQVMAAFEQIRRSHSWRITRPLRVARRGIGAMRRVMVRGTKAVLRRPAHAMRPALKRLADHPTLRKSAFAMMGGRDSVISRRVRVFLFGPLPTVAPHHIARIGSELDPAVYSRRERAALAALQRAMPSSTEAEE